MARLSPLIGKGPPRGNRVISLVTRIAIIILAFAALALSAWGIWLMDNNFGMDMSVFDVPEDSFEPGFFGDLGDFGFRRLAKRQAVLNVPSNVPPGKDPLALMIYTSIQIFIVFGGSLVVQYLAPRLFFRVAVLIGYFLTIIIALAAWAFMASSAMDYGEWNELYEEWLGPTMDFFLTQTVDNPITQIYAAEAAAAGAMALAWLLVVIETVLFVRACMVEPKTEVEQAQAASNPQGLPPQMQEEGNARAFHTPPQPTQLPPQAYYPPQQQQMMPSPMSQHAAP